ncbi:MAG: hypothetical protein RLZZ124_1754 [Cyanobacteriota bacterium]
MFFASLLALLAFFMILFFLLVGLVASVGDREKKAVGSQAVLVPAFALHGYVLSASVVGWESTPLAAYLVGLLVSQALLLLVSLTLVRAWALRFSAERLRLCAGMLMGIGAAFAWTNLVP